MQKGVQCFACIGKRTGKVLSVKMDKDTADDAASWLRVVHRGGVSVVPAIVTPVEKKRRRTHCPDCLGRGEIVEHSDATQTVWGKCKTCGGTGKPKRRKAVKRA